MKSFVSKKLCWFMIFILIFMWSGIIEHKAFAQQTNKPSSEDLKQIVDQIENIFQALEQTEREIPRDTFDPLAIIKKTGKDPIKQFEWVRDYTFWVPYLGSLRGPIGVLMDRLGNSLDRSLLLAKILELSGQKVRLAKGTIPFHDAEKILQEIRFAPKNHIPIQQEYKNTLDELIEKYRIDYHLDAEKIHDFINKSTSEYTHLYGKASQRAKTQVKEIKDMLGTHAPKAEILQKKERNAAINAISDHWWVQMKKDDIWVDLDPILPNMNPGESMLSPQQTYEPDDLDEDFFHFVDIRIMVERWEQGVLKTESVLEHTLQPSELFDKRIGIHHYPMNWPENLKLLEEKDPLQSAKNTILDQKEWLPVLSIGAELIKQSSFMNTGEKNDNPREKGKGGAGGITRGLFNALAGGESEKKNSKLTAEWLEFGIRSPGRSEIKIRRKIFDLLGHAARLSKEVPEPETTETLQLEMCLALLSKTEIVLQVCHLSPNFLAHLMARDLIANRVIIKKLFESIDIERSQDFIEKASETISLPGPEYNLAFARTEWSRFSNYVYHDHPNIIRFLKGIRQDAEGNFVVYNGFDIVDNRLAVQPNSELNSFDVRLEQGVMDTNAEALLIGKFGDVIENTGELFANSINKGAKWITIRNPADLARSQVEFPKNVQANIKQDLVDGNIVIVPQGIESIESQTGFCWWRINPQTGDTLGVANNGYGQSLTEYIVYMTLSTISYIDCLFSAFSAKKSWEKKMLFFICLLGAASAGTGILTAEFVAYGLVAALANLMVSFFSYLSGVW